jgi:tetratricopeptide (TPR) repeat protein
MKAAPLSEADAHAYLGDLLLHTQRLKDAEGQLQQALELDANSSMAQTAYGMLRVRQGRLDDARPYLEKAVAANAQNYLAHFYYAFALSGLSMNEYRVVSAFPDDVAATMRSELTKAIALKPDFIESYSLLGFVNLVRNEQVDETIEMLKKTLNVSRGNQRVLFMLAQLYMRKEKFAEARQLLTPIAENSPDPEERKQAEALIQAARHTEEQMAQLQEFRKQQMAARPQAERNSVSTMKPTSAPTPDDMNSALLEALRKPKAGEQRMQGMLTAIDCNSRGITFSVRAGDHVFKFHSVNFDGLDITAFTTGISGDITCGPRKPENWIILTYAPPKAGVRNDGEVSAIEFVPQTFVLKQ